MPNQYFPEKRPEQIDAEVIRFQNDNNRWVGIVGLIEKRPYEIYTGLGDDFWMPQWVNKGWIIERELEDKKLVYDFKFEDKQNYKITIQGLSRSFDRESWPYSKLISLLLQNEVPLELIVKVLNSVTFDFDSKNVWKEGIKKTLESYLKKPEPVL